MKGIVFNLLEKAVVDAYGEETWDTLLASAHVAGAYTSLGSYDDRELAALVDAASGQLKVPPEDVLRWFGRKAMPELSARYPAFFTPHRSTRAFLLTLNDIIHPEVRKLYPGASVPDFEFEDVGASLHILYRSPKRMCAFAEGLILGAADHYGERVTIEQPTCMRRGDDQCTLAVTFAKE